MGKQQKLLNKVNLALALIAMSGCASKQKDCIEPAEIVLTRRMYQYHFVEPQETVETVAQRYQMSKAELIKINQLCPPFNLHRGQRLHVHKRDFSQHIDRCLVPQEQVYCSSTKGGRPHTYNPETCTQSCCSVGYQRVRVAPEYGQVQRSKTNIFWPIVGLGAIGAATVAKLCHSGAKSVGSGATVSPGGGGGGTLPVVMPTDPNPLQPGPPNVLPTVIPGGGGTTMPVVNPGGGGYTTMPSTGTSTGGGGSTWIPAVAAGAGIPTLMLVGAGKNKGSKETIANISSSGGNNEVFYAGSSLKDQKTAIACFYDPLEPYTLTWPINNQLRKTRGGYTKKLGGILIINSLGECFVRPALRGIIESITKESTGWKVVVSHFDPKFKTVYGRLEQPPTKFGLKKGDFVTKIDIIGTIAKSNTQVLFFQLLDNGRATNPLWFLSCANVQNPYTSVKQEEEISLKCCL